MTEILRVIAHEKDRSSKPRFKSLQDPLKLPGTISSFRSWRSWSGFWASGALSPPRLGIVIGHFTPASAGCQVSSTGWVEPDTRLPQSMTDRVLDLHIAGIEF
jgi:hypothetical protein